MRHRVRLGLRTKLVLERKELAANDTDHILTYDPKLLGRGAAAHIAADTASSQR